MLNTSRSDNITSTFLWLILDFSVSFIFPQAIWTRVICQFSPWLFGPVSFASFPHGCLDPVSFVSFSKAVWILSHLPVFPEDVWTQPNLRVLLYKPVIIASWNFSHKHYLRNEKYDGVSFLLTNPSKDMMTLD